MLKFAFEYMTCLLHYIICAVWTGSVELHGVLHFQNRIQVLLMCSDKKNLNRYHTVHISHHTHMCVYSYIIYYQLILACNLIVFKHVFTHTHFRSLQCLTKKVCQAVQTPFIDKEIGPWKNPGSWPCLCSVTDSDDVCSWAVGPGLPPTSWVNFR